MSSVGSRSDDSDVDSDELALHIALERSKMESCGNSGFGATPPLPRWRRADAAAGPAQPTRSSCRAAQTPLAPRRVLPPPTASPCTQRYVLVPAPPTSASTRTPESKAHVARRERQRSLGRGEAGQSVRCHRGMPTERDEDERLLAWVYRRSLTTAEKDARRLRRKNAKAPRLAIEQSEREAKEAAKEKTRLARLKQEQDKAVRRIKELIVLSDDDYDNSESDSSSYDDQDPLPATDDYSCVGDPKGKGPAKKW
ncbi:Phosphorylated carbohydrates phosphatase [Hordeum vulgare]|nr:Phosphorylated carbohydrates phosphatase [Hordeum vulgare]